MPELTTMRHFPPLLRYHTVCRCRWGALTISLLGLRGADEQLSSLQLMAVMHQAAFIGASLEQQYCRAMGSGLGQHTCALASC
jgi:hypothetical protein